mmetsp:Transcript_20359/g.59463  ORF Transcript_20359/g.59463 Transcript_20359/m.59463 type:complete len:375 (-) Transcript_20359:144-1268(-)
MAKANGLRVYLGANCLVRGVRWWEEEAAWQRDWLEDQPVDLVANEGGQWGEAPWPEGPQVGGGRGLLYVITVRQPLDRVLSHYHHERAAGKLRGVGFADFVEAKAFVHWRSNFYVRLLGGCAWAHCGEAHLARATAVLRSYFSVVLVSDDPTTYSFGARVLLSQRLGWEVVDPEPFSSRGTHSHSCAADELAGAPGALLQLAELNSLDLAFHAAAKSLFHRQLLDALAESKPPRALLRKIASAQQPLVPVAGERGDEFVATLSRVIFGVGSAVEEPEASSTEARRLASALTAPELDRSGYGGHTKDCRGVGGMPLYECRRRLVGSSSCTGLSYKDGVCYLHDTTASNFWAGDSPGNQFQRRRGPPLPRPASVAR